MGDTSSVLSPPQPGVQLCLPHPLCRRQTVHPLLIVCSVTQFPTAAGERTHLTASLTIHTRVFGTTALSWTFVLYSDSKSVLCHVTLPHPLLQVRSLLAHFDPTLQAHLSLAFQDLQVYSQKRGCDPVEQSECLRAEEASRSVEHPRELFQVLLQSHNEQDSCRYLLQEALVQRCPVLAVLAACIQVNGVLMLM